MRRMSFIGLAQDAPTKAAVQLPLPANVRKDVFLSALLEMPTTKRTSRNPLEWASAAVLHIAFVGTLIVVPLYATGTIHLSKFDEVPLVAPPPPPALPAAGTAASPRIAHPRARFTYEVRKKLITPNSIPKRVSQEDAGAAAPPDLGGAVGGVPGGVVGGEIGGLAGGAFGGTGTAVPPPPPQPQPTKRLVRASSLLRPPRQTYSIDPEYPALARQAHIFGTVVVDAVIDERGNVVQARAVSGHPLLVAAALGAVLQWKYEPSSLNGQPVSVELNVQVIFRPKS
jgi:periplasmic protein TonB